MKNTALDDDQSLNRGGQSQSEQALLEVTPELQFVLQSSASSQHTLLGQQVMLMKVGVGVVLAPILLKRNRCTLLLAHVFLAQISCHAVGKIGNIDVSSHSAAFDFIAQRVVWASPLMVRALWSRSAMQPVKPAPILFPVLFPVHHL